jgi:hypothetical protein
LTLPENVEERSIRAETKDGVLYVHLPKTAKAEKTKPVQIKVEYPLARPGGDPRPLRRCTEA